MPPGDSDFGALPSDEASVIVGIRQTEYDHPSVVYARAAKLWSVILDTPLDELQVALCMCALKLAREIGRHKWDNLVDICGYANVVAMIQERRTSADTDSTAGGAPGVAGEELS